LSTLTVHILSSSVTTVDRAQTLASLWTVISRCRRMSLSAPYDAQHTAFCASYIKSYDRCRLMRPSQDSSPRVHLVAFRLLQLSSIYGISDTLLRRLQAVQNAAARLITDTRRCDHITPVLQELHRLRPNSIKLSS